MKTLEYKAPELEITELELEGKFCDSYSDLPSIGDEEVEGEGE